MTTELTSKVTEPKTLTQWANLIEEWCEKKGWNEGLTIAKATMNFHAEISEAWEEIRNGNPVRYVWNNHRRENEVGMAKPEGFGVEIADLLIRVLHLCGHFKIDIEYLMELKQKYNNDRPYRHGGKTA